MVAGRIRICKSKIQSATVIFQNKKYRLKDSLYINCSKFSFANAEQLLNDTIIEKLLSRKAEPIYL
jgi:hypothetical protein